MYDYSIAPVSKKNGKAPMFFVWRILEHCMSFNLPIPDEIQTRINEHVLPIARREIDDEETSSKHLSSFTLKQNIETRDRYIADRMYTLQEKADSNTSIEELAFTLRDLLVKERKDFIKAIINQQFESGKSKVQATKFAEEKAHNTPFINIDLDPSTIERIFRRCKNT